MECRGAGDHFPRLSLSIIWMMRSPDSGAPWPFRPKNSSAGISMERRLPFLPSGPK